LEDVGALEVNGVPGEADFLKIRQIGETLAQKIKES
jgi:hypothetical protein